MRTHLSWEALCAETITRYLETCTLATELVVNSDGKDGALSRIGGE